MWSSHRDETINHTNEGRRQAENMFETRDYLVGKVIHWKLRKRLKLDQTTKLSMHKPESVPDK